MQIWIVKVLWMKLKKYFENEAPVVFSIDEGNGKMLELMDGCEVSDVTFHREDYSN